MDISPDGRSEEWDLYLCDDNNTKADGHSVEVSSWSVPPLGIGGGCFGPSRDLDTRHPIRELDPPSERGLNMSLNLTAPVPYGM